MQNLIIDIETIVMKTSKRNIYLHFFYVSVHLLILIK